MNTSSQNTRNVIMRGISRHERDHADLLCLCTDRLCVLLSEIARLVKEKNAAPSDESEWK